MSWEIGVSTGSLFPFQNTEQAVRSIADADFSQAEVFLQTPSECTNIYGRRILRVMFATGIRIHSVHIHSRDIDPFSLYEPRRRDAEKLYNQALDLAYTLNAKVITWHGASQKALQAGVDTELMWETIALWREWADEAEIFLTLENVSWGMMRTPEEVRHVQNQVPELHFTFDCFQAAEANVSPNTLIRTMDDQIVNVHLSDFAPNRARHLMPGRGSLNWEALLKTLAGTHYAGPLILELSDLNQQHYLPALEQSREFVETVVDEIGLSIRGM